MRVIATSHATGRTRQQRNAAVSDTTMKNEKEQRRGTVRDPLSLCATRPETRRTSNHNTLSYVYNEADSAGHRYDAAGSLACAQRRSDVTRRAFATRGTSVHRRLQLVAKFTHRQHRSRGGNAHSGVQFI